jgi:2-polyprenyl-6-methoxyphenol hydroxylase-like FAD-dependent oxidoreductase
MVNRSVDVIVVGGGIIGTTAAIALCDLGYHVVLIGNPKQCSFSKEKDKTITKRLAGEYLQPAGLEALEILGLSGTFL